MAAGRQGGRAVDPPRLARRAQLAKVVAQVEGIAAATALLVARGHGGGFDKLTPNGDFALKGTDWMTMAAIELSSPSALLTARNTGLPDLRSSRAKK